MENKKNKNEVVELIKKKLNNETCLSYKDISNITGYHPKYISKLKKEIIEGTVKLEHGNKNRKPHNAISNDEIAKIQQLYARSSASVRKFCKFYGKHSYSCIYKIVHNIEKKV